MHTDIAFYTQFMLVIAGGVFLASLSIILLCSAYFSTKRLVLDLRGRTR